MQSMHPCAERGARRHASLCAVKHGATDMTARREQSSHMPWRSPSISRVQILGTNPRHRVRVSPSFCMVMISAKHVPSVRQSGRTACCSANT